MFKKKKIEFVPDGDPYADDPYVYKTRRGLSHDQLARNWKIRVAKGGDIKANMAREFSPWFLEKEKEKNIEDGMTWKEIIKRRLKLFCIALFSTSFYDYVYIALLIGFIVSIPLYETEFMVPRSLCSLLPMCMSLVAIIPVVGAIIIKLTMWTFLRNNTTEKQVRFWGLFFFVTLKVLHFRDSLVPKFLRFKNNPLTKLKKMKKKQGTVVDVEGGDAEGEGGGESEGVGDIEEGGREGDNLLNRENDGENEESNDNRGGEDDENTVEDESSEDDLSSDEEVEVAENEIAWVCRCCSEFNLQEKVVQEKSLKSRRIGTKENADKIKLLVRTMGKIHEHYVVEFKQQKNVNRCTKCGTPADYKPRKCAKQFFNPLQDFSEQLHAKDAIGAVGPPPEGDNDVEAGAPAVELSEEEKIAKRMARGRRGSTTGRDSVLMMRNKSLASSLSSRDISTLDKIRILFNKIRDRYSAFVDSTPPNEQILYNDHEFKNHLKGFMPFVERSKRHGEQFKIGEDIEAIERKTMWYPGIIKRVGDNGTYDIIYNNGELVETVLPVKIRYPATYKLTRTSRFMLSLILVTMLVMPLVGYSFYSKEVEVINDRGIREPSTSTPEQYRLALLPLFAVGAIGFLGMSISYCNAFRHYARSGLGKNCRVYIFAALPMIFLFAFCFIVFAKMSDNDVEDGPQRFNWWYASVAQFLFCGIVSIQWKQISFAMGMMSWFLTFPLTGFSFMMSLSLDGVIQLPNRFVLYAPLLAWGLMLLFFRMMVPYVRESKY
mgnify:FL=1